MPAQDIFYSNRYRDTDFEYRHVILPLDIAAKIPRVRLLTETEWRNLGIQQSKGWVHYMIHKPEPHILLFKRPIDADTPTPVQEQEQQQEQQQQPNQGQ